MRALVTVSLLAAACGGSRPQLALAPVPAPATRATLVGPLCASGQECTCRDDKAPADGGAGAPDGGAKRFEVRVGPAPNAIWVTVDDMVLYKSDQRADACFYVDLAPGDHHLGVRAHQDGGLGAAVTIHEYGAAAKSWYDTFHFECGTPGACSNDELDQEKADLAQAPHGLHDPCGSVKVKGVTWATGTEPDQRHPEDLAVAFTLDVYKFAPDKPHGDGGCVARTE